MGKIKGISPGESKEMGSSTNVLPLWDLAEQENWRRNIACTAALLIKEEV